MYYSVLFLWDKRGGFLLFARFAFAFIVFSEFICALTVLQSDKTGKKIFMFDLKDTFPRFACSHILTKLVVYLTGYYSIKCKLKICFNDKKIWLIVHVHCRSIMFMISSEKCCKKYQKLYDKHEFVYIQYTVYTLSNVYTMSYLHTIFYIFSILFF